MLSSEAKLLLAMFNSTDELLNYKVYCDNQNSDVMIIYIQANDDTGEVREIQNQQQCER